jgi:hypothetical protein
VNENKIIRRIIMSKRKLLLTVLLSFVLIAHIIKWAIGSPPSHFSAISGWGLVLFSLFFPEEQ